MFRFFLFSILVWPVVATAQPVRQREADLNRFIQELVPVQTEGVDVQVVFDNLFQLYANPLDLNAVTREELAATNLLTEKQLNHFFAYRQELGPFLSVYELQVLPDFDLPTVRRLLPFVTVDSRVRSLRNPTDHYLTLRMERVLEQQKGFSPAEPDTKGNLPRRYLGDPPQWFLRYRYSRPRRFSFGLTAEQDPGEPFGWQPGRYYYGVNFLSFHAQVQNRGRWKNITVGDFQVQAGQGLVLSAGFFLGKGSEPVAGVRRPTLGARPYASVTEYGYLRGITATYELTKKLHLTLLAARNRRDANIVAGEEPTVSSLQTSGLHRTASELDDRASLREQNVGAHLQYQTDRFQLGATFLQTTFDKALQRRNAAYNQFEFSGKQNRLAGLHGSYVWRNVNFFGELAYSSGSRTGSGGLGVVSGAIASLTKRLDATLLYRHFDRNFHSFYANGFSEGSRTINETGLYAGARYVVYRRLTVGAYLDQFRFPWLRYLVDKPSGGRDYLLQTTWTPTKKWTLNAIFRQEFKEKNLPGTKPVQVVRTRRNSLVLNAEYNPTRILSVRTRVQGGGFRYRGQPGSQGLVVAQDATADFGRLSLSGRLAWFRTDDWDSRQYLYERDVLYAFSIPAYYNRGWRHYLLVQYTLNRHADLWLRWARTDARQADSIGSDLDEISKPHKTEVKVQLRWRF